MIWQTIGIDLLILLIGLGAGFVAGYREAEREFAARAAVLADQQAEKIQLAVDGALAQHASASEAAALLAASRMP